MADVKFTPGPWRAVPLHTCWSIRARDRSIGHLNHGGHGFGPEVKQADANLIAASPDLYDALAAFVSDCTNEECERCISARAALAKAEGRS